MLVESGERQGVVIEEKRFRRRVRLLSHDCFEVGVWDRREASVCHLPIRDGACKGVVVFSGALNQRCRPSARVLLALFPTEDLCAPRVEGVVSPVGGAQPLEKSFECCDGCVGGRAVVVVKGVPHSVSNVVLEYFLEDDVSEWDKGWV